MVDTAAPKEKARGSESGGGVAARVRPRPTTFAEVVSAYETPLLRYAGHLVGPEVADPEDVVQETFLRFHRHVEKNGPVGSKSLASWLFRVAHNAALDLHRRKSTRDRAHERVGDEAARRAAELDSPEGLAAVVRRAACERAVEELQKLPPQQKHVLLLKVIQDMTMRDIAKVTGTSLGNVAYHLNQALKELARRLKAAGVI